MIRPHHFYSNRETMHDNRFQRDTENHEKEDIARNAYAEVTRMAAQLRAAGVTVHLFEDSGEHDTPDSVFPNNWFTTHQDGRLFLYPMRCRNRQREVRQDILDFLAQHYQLQSVTDLRHYGDAETFLEGTGSVIFDHQVRIAYACLSQRTQLKPLLSLCTAVNYQAHPFNAALVGMPIYHTNVMLSVASQFAMVGLDCIPDYQEREKLCRQLQSTGKEIVNLSPSQILQFAGNCLELQGSNGKLLALSSSAMASLHANQIAKIEKYAELLVIDVPTIETAGGSVRCMLASIHLPTQANAAIQSN
ncbi:amidinotransferase [Undibacterium sp. LX15W]|uniref:Amidinotransferase n=2 Tax=Undibacterium flavidum TaxID=2762297 RepID=A0ABR6Y7I2_9BURK|nr:amidinotransferase [Undibacterium flavidum]